MRLQRCDDVVEAVAIDVVHDHLRAARRAAPVLTSKLLRMIRPRWTVDFRLWTFDCGLSTVDCRLLRLFPPSVHIEDVDAAIAVDVAGADAMCGVSTRLTNLRREPGAGRVGWIR